jgi:arylsulfatase A-like enzyme
MEKIIMEITRCLVLFLMLMLLFSRCREKEAGVASKPNVILILTDDQGYGDLSLHGNDSLNTPHLDFLGTHGVRFDRFYVSPVCAPTRASLLTGRYHLRTGVYWVTRGAENMNPDEKTIAEVFKHNGYITGCFGKWHNGAHYPFTPNAQGFDEFVGFKAGHWSNYFDTVLDDNQDTLHTEGYITNVLTAKALEFIQKNRRNPFFCYIPYNAPHTPYQVPDEYFDRFIDKLHIDDSITNVRRATIYGMCENIDDNVGQLMNELDRMGLADKTIIVFLTDNGPNGNRYNGNMRGKKGSVHEGGVRVPCFFYWKNKIEGGRKIFGLAAHIDVLPTLVNLCQLDFTPEKPLDGIDLSSFLLDEKNNRVPDRKIYNHQNQGSHLIMYPGAIRTPRYRFVTTGDHRYSLYDMIEDPGETKDISESNPALSASLYTDYVNWFNEVKATASTEREIPIGYKESPEVYLPAHEAYINQGLTYEANANGWAHDWIIDWDQTGDTISWNIQVVRPGEFEFQIQYNMKPSDVGSEITLETDGQNINHQLTQPFYSAIHPYYDRSVREVEAFEKDWGIESLGKLKLVKGDYRLKLFSPRIASGQVAEVKGLIVKKL